MHIQSQAPFLESVYIVPERIPDATRYPFNLPCIPNFHLDVDSPITFLVGENGSGKSTILEAIVDLCGYAIIGGGKADAGGGSESSELVHALRPRFRRKPKDGFFFRAETLFDFANTLDARAKDPYFGSVAYRRYGGNSLHARSHGESFLDVFQHRIHEGLFLLDEPEAALSPQRQLALLCLLADRIQRGNTQFIIATHSPILLTFPGARIINFEDPELRQISLEETSHYQITKGILNDSNTYWNHLLEKEG